MGAETPAIRKRTAAEAAAQFGVSPRTIQRLVAEPREQFLDRSHARQDRALELKETGLKHREVGEILGCTERAAQSLVHAARKRREIEALRNPQKRESPAAEVLPGQTSIEDVSGE